MRFVRIKKEQECRGCPSLLLPGDEGVLVMHRITTEVGEVSIPYIYHVGCYIEWNREVFNYKYQLWKAGSLPKRKRAKRKVGRPRLYTMPIITNRIRSLLHYYKKVGNEDKVQELQSRLDELRVLTN